METTDPPTPTSLRPAIAGLRRVDRLRRDTLHGFRWIRERPPRRVLFDCPPKGSMYTLELWLGFVPPATRYDG
jgi:hypothetical protein